MNRLLIVVLCAVVFVAAPAKHITVDDTLRNSVLYPSTVHTFQITVPDSYDGSNQLALYVGLDGVLCNAPAVIDSLMHCGIMPCTIGVFLQPGLVRDDSGKVVRYNRSNEFDATDDRFARFLATEVLPMVDGRRLPDGRVIQLSNKPSERMIFGLSSGGIAAFVAAWHSPDMFGKVFSGCGTFVPMRGGNDLEAIVRKHEPKALRVFLQDGFFDTWNPIFGSWYEHNMLLASALRFAGYDCAFDWAKGGHSVRRASEIFPRVMTWMWRPDTVPSHTGNELLAQLLIDGEKWQPVRLKNQRHPEKYAVYPDSSFRVYAADGSNWLMQELLSSDGHPYAAQRFYWLHSYDNDPVHPSGMAFDSRGNLWVATKAGIQICDQNGRVRAIFSLPSGLSGDISITISQGLVTLADANGTVFQRRFNVEAPQSGARPQSQGAG